MIRTTKKQILSAIVALITSNSLLLTTDGEIKSLPAIWAKDLLATISPATIFVPSPAQAQEATPIPDATPTEGTTSGVVNTTEGISGDMDMSHREPLLSVNQGYTNGVPRLLVDASIQNDEYKKFPIRFEFYVNRHLVSTQMRSTELPGAIGLDITESIALPPFNYSVVATLLHPNRQFTTVLHGAIYPVQLGTKLSCTVSMTPVVATPVSEEASSESGGDYSAEVVQLTQPLPDQIKASFEPASTLNKDNTVVVDLNLTVVDTTVSGSVNISTDKQVAIPHSVSGTVEIVDNELKSLSVSDAEVTVSCG